MSNETPPFRDRPAVRAVIGFGCVPDPVDAAIERHRAAREELQRASTGVDAAMTASKRAEAEADAVFSAASNADGAAWADLLATRPGDVPGAVRLLRYMAHSPASEVVEDPQDLLRQLLAAVEAGETGERQGEGAAAGAEPQAVAEPDPALAVVAEYRAAWNGLGAAIEAAGGAGVPEVPEAEAADSAAYARLQAVRPTTPAGFRALAETWAWRLQAERVAVEDGEPGSTASHAAASLISGAGVCLPGSMDAPVSPALAEMIARHRNLVQRSEAHGLSDTVADPLFDEAWSVFRQACSFPIAGRADLAAKVDLMATEITEGVERGEIDTAMHAWSCLRADLLRPGVLEGLCADGTDAELLALAPIWETARDLYERRVQEQIAVSDAASDIEALPSRDLPHEEWMRLVDGWRERTGVAAVEAAVGQALGDLGRIEDRIAALPARSLAGLRLKAMVARRHEDDDVEWPAGLGAGIARDLLALRQREPTERAEPTEEAVDWHNPPPGFMASPAIEPYSFARVSEGIAIELGRLRSIALAEFERRSAAGMTPEGEERLRRDLHLDTLSKAARGEGGFAVWPTPGAEAADVRDGQANPRLCALVTAWEAAERAGNAPGRSDEERAPLIDHASGLLRDVYAFPARTMADICAKLPAYRDEAANTGDAPDTPDSEVTLEACALRGLVADLERLAAERTTGPEHPDAELLRLIASVEAAQVRCDAAHTTWAEAEKAAAATRPGQPDELRRANDFQHFWGLAANPHSPEFYTADEVAKFRQYEPVGHANVKAEAAARARAAEIVAAFWGWQAQIRAHDEACGVAALDRAHDETCDDYQKVLSAVVSARPATLAGVLAKARISLSEDTIEFDRILRDDLLAMSGSLA